MVGQRTGGGLLSPADFSPLPSSASAWGLRLAAAVGIFEIVHPFQGGGMGIPIQGAHLEETLEHEALALGR